MDVQDLRPVATETSALVMDDISVGPGCVMRRLARWNILTIDETYGPFDAPAPHNPCMRSSVRRAATCAPWGFSVLRYTRRAIELPSAWPRPKRPGANRGRQCWEVE